jgi:hypothetical protein
MRNARNLVVALATVAVITIAVRLALPWIVESYVNDELRAIGEYSGSVADVDLSLLRGAYVLNGVTIVKSGADSETPFFEAPHMDISVQWGALLNGELVGELLMRSPVLNMIEGATEEETQLGTGTNWPAQVRELFPFTFNRVQVIDGLVTFRAPGIEAEESLTLRDMQMVLRNLTNVREENQQPFAEIELNGRVLGDAPLGLAGRIDPNEKTPTFDVNLTIEQVQLANANPWLEEFLKVDAERGVFSMYTELAASDGYFQGYVKPIMENPEILELDEPASGPFQKAWEGVVDLALEVFENPKEDQVATQIPYSGRLENPEAGVLNAIVNLLRNAFVGAFTHSLEGTVSLRDVDTGVELEPSG